MGGLELKSIAVTFDVDQTDYHTGEQFDEFELTFNFFRSVFLEFPAIKTTWNLRIDDQMKVLYGTADHVFSAHADKIAWLKENGHEIGFHFHSYIQKENTWQQNPDEGSVLKELERNAQLARGHGLQGVRMGWTYQTNATLKLLEEAGFIYDSSAMPRPNYLWEKSLRDWTLTGQTPYYPSRSDYRIGGSPAAGILELPISTQPISAPTDDREMIRYISPAYRHDIFAHAMRQNKLEDTVVLLHPYEVIAGGNHGLVAFSEDEFRQNMKWLVGEGYLFNTLGQLANKWKKLLNQHEYN